MTWNKVEGSFYSAHTEIVELCEKHFGPRLDEGYNKITGAKKNNHGNWKWEGGTVHFRYKKDVVWFMLAAAHLIDKRPKRVSAWPFP
jgi:hypothetical protein